MRAKLSERRLIARDTLEITLQLSRAVKFFAGQSFKLTLLDPLYRDRAGNSRFFSIVNPPRDSRVLKTAFRIGASAFKRSLLAAKLGSIMEIDNLGGVFLLPNNKDKEFVFIAGGVGITPFMSMLQSEREKRDARKIILLYSNSDPAQTAYLEELRLLAKRSPNFELIFAMTRGQRRRGGTGRIDAKFIRKHVSRPKRAYYYIAGPPIMVHDVSEAVASLGVKVSQIKTEEFTGY